MYKLGTGEDLWVAREKYPEIFLEQFRRNVLKPLGHAFIHRILENKLKERNDNRDIRVLEIGHGATSPFFDLYGARLGVECHGIDDNDRDRTVSINSLAALRARYPNVTFHSGYVGENSNLPSEYFDIVCSVSVIEHIPVVGIDAFHRDIHRILRLGGEQIHSYDRPWGGDIKTMKVVTCHCFVIQRQLESQRSLRRVARVMQ